MWLVDDSHWVGGTSSDSSVDVRLLVIFDAMCSLEVGYSDCETHELGLHLTMHKWSGDACDF